MLAVQKLRVMRDFCKAGKVGLCLRQVGIHKIKYINKIYRVDRIGRIDRKDRIEKGKMGKDN